MEKVIVFDFDKTLTDKDTVLPFFLFCCKMRPLGYFFLPIYYLIKILSKIRLLTVKKEKELGLMFFCPKDKKRFQKLSCDFHSTLRLNQIYYLDYKNAVSSGTTVIVASASFESYLKDLFPDAVVVGTTLLFDKVRDRLLGIDKHPFGLEKKNMLNDLGVLAVDVFYTDSKNDLPTARMAKKVVWIKSGKVLKIYENTDF